MVPWWDHDLRPVTSRRSTQLLKELPVLLTSAGHLQTRPAAISSSTPYTAQATA